MKAFITIGLVVALTGCGTVQETVKYNFAPSVDLAKEECTKIGFKVGTPNYQMCVMRQTESIRSARTQRAANRSKDVICRPWGNGVKCEEW